MANAPEGQFAVWRCQLSKGAAYLFWWMPVRKDGRNRSRPFAQPDAPSPQFATSGRLGKLGSAIAVVITVLMCWADGALSELLWRPYIDPVLGYSILYPAGLFDLPPVQEHGGITLTAGSGARLFIFGGPNREGRSTEATAAELSGATDVYQVTYRRLVGSWLVLSGFLTDRPGGPPRSIFYERIAFSPDRQSLAGFRLVYSPLQRAVFDPVIATIGNSLRPPVTGLASLAARPPPQLGGSGPSASLTHDEWCQRKYSTYNPTTDSFLRFDGAYVPCIGPGE